jgi:SAM-dependent methyltransferase
VLDVGCGTGTTTLQAANAVIPGGSVIGIDNNPEATAIAAHRACRVGGITIVTGDAAKYQPPEAVDVIIARFATMLFIDPVAAHRNLAAALRPGGRFVAVAWQAPNRNLWHALPMQAVHAHLQLDRPQISEAPGPFALAEPTRIDSVLREAGFAVVRISPIEAHSWLARDVDDAVDFFDATSGDELRMLAPAAVIDAIRDTLRASLERYRTDTGIELPSAVWLIEATIEEADSQPQSHS